MHMRELQRIEKKVELLKREAEDSREDWVIIR